MNKNLDKNLQILCCIEFRLKMVRVCGTRAGFLEIFILIKLGLEKNV